MGKFKKGYIINLVIQWAMLKAGGVLSSVLLRRCLHAALQSWWQEREERIRLANQAGHHAALLLRHKATRVQEEAL